MFLAHIIRRVYGGKTVIRKLLKWNEGHFSTRGGQHIALSYLQSQLINLFSYFVTNIVLWMPNTKDAREKKTICNICHNALHSLVRKSNGN